MREEGRACLLFWTILLLVFIVLTHNPFYFDTLPPPRPQARPGSGSNIPPRNSQKIAQIAIRERNNTYMYLQAPALPGSWSHASFSLGLLEVTEDVTIRRRMRLVNLLQEEQTVYILLAFRTRSQRMT